MTITKTAFKQLKSDMMLYQTYDRPKWKAITISLLEHQGYNLSGSQRRYLDKHCCGAS